MCNVLDLDQVCDIANEVYFDVIRHLEIESRCVENDDSTGGTKNTEFGTELYYLIEDAVKSAIKYKEDGEDDDYEDDDE